MYLLDLPPELFHEVLVYAVIARGTQDGKTLVTSAKRGLRLKLVCKAFLQGVQTALFESGLLDNCLAQHVGQNWCLKHQHGAEQFWQAYLVYRVRTEKNPAVGRFVEIREIAEVVAKHARIKLEGILSDLCWLALESATSGQMGKRSTWGLGSNKGQAQSRDLSLLSAAAYFGLETMAAELLSPSLSPLYHDNLFPPALKVAAWRGHLHLLDILQKHVLTSGWRHFLTNGETPVDAETYQLVLDLSICGAAMGGSVEILKSFLIPPSPGRPGYTKFIDYGYAEPSSHALENILRRARNSTRDLSAFEYLGSWSTSGPSIEELSEHLYWHAMYGNLEMVQYLLDRGADVNGANAVKFDSPLSIACRKQHEDIVDLLLERGASLIATSEGRALAPLADAVSSGSRCITQKLINHNVNVNARHPFEGYGVTPIWWAFVLEDAPMIELLMRNGATLDNVSGYPGIGGHALEMAHHFGLDSVAALLHKLGVTHPTETMQEGMATWGCWPTYWTNEAVD